MPESVPGRTLPQRRDAHPSRTLRVAQIANYVGPTSGGLRVVVEQLGLATLRGGGSRLLVLPAEYDSSVGVGRDRRITIAGPVLPRSRGRYRVLLRRRAVVEALEEFGPDVVEVHDQTTLAWVGGWARRNGVHSVLFAHERLDLALGEASGLPTGWLDGPARRWSAHLARSFDVIVCPSDFAALPFPASASARTAAARVVPLGVDLQTFSPKAEAEGGRPGRPSTSGGDAVWDFGSSGARLIFAGRLSPEKAPGTALQVLRLVRATGRDARLLVVGDGPMRSSLQRHARRERLPVRFLGHVNGRTALASLLSSADVALAPGPRETFGLGVLEAMACGTPVVVSTGGALQEMLLPGAGAAASTPEAMAHGVGALLRDPQTHRAARCAARAAAERFPWSATTAALDTIAYAPARPGVPA